MDALDILSEAALRPLQAAQQFRAHLTAEVLNGHVNDHPNSVAWLLWHIGREIDVQTAHLTGGEEVWTRGGFNERLDLGEVGGTLGYGHTPEEARGNRTDDADGLLEYLEAATESPVHYINNLHEDQLDHLLEQKWEPPRTRGGPALKKHSD